MSATNQFESDLLDLIFTNIAAPNIGDAAGLQPSAADGVFYLSLHDAPLSDTDTDQTSNEIAYTGYARTSIGRTAADFTVTGNTVANDNIVSFPACTGGTVTATHFGIGFESAGVGYLLMWGALDASLAISNGITPEFAAGAFTVTLD